MIQKKLEVLNKVGLSEDNFEESELEEQQTMETGAEDVEDLWGVVDEVEDFDEADLAELGEKDSAELGEGDLLEPGDNILARSQYLVSPNLTAIQRRLVVLNKLGLDKDNFEQKNMEMEMEREQTMDTEDVEEIGRTW